MPHDVMNTMHEQGMPGSHHWLFWMLIAAGFAFFIFVVWWFGIRSKD